MVRRILFGMIWFVALYIGACGITGGIAGARAGSKNPGNASQVGAQAGAQAVAPLAPYFLAGSLVLAIAGTVSGVLPGTHAERWIK